MSSVVPVACYYYVSGCMTFGADLRPERIRETRCHVWYCHAEFVLESSRDGASGEFTGHPVGREVVGPDSVVCI